jgi:hypothetical protein
MASSERKNEHTFVVNITTVLDRCPGLWSDEHRHMTRVNGLLDCRTRDLLGDYFVQLDNAELVTTNMLIRVVERRLFFRSIEMIAQRGIAERK